MRASSIHTTRRTRGVVAGLVTTTVLALSILGGGTALAATPNWTVGFGTDRTVSPQPTTGQSSTSVTAGNQVGFYTWLWNRGTSNISQLFLTANFDGASVGATFVVKDAAGATVRSGSCGPAAALDCNVGPVNGGNTVYVTAGFQTKSDASGSLAVAFEYNTTGVAPGKNNSHGDAKSLSDSVGISAGTDGDAKGDFNLNTPGGLTINNAPVGGSNTQSTSLTIDASGFGAFVNDNPNLPAAKCTNALIAPILVNNPWFSCKKLTSLTSLIEVGNGGTFKNGNSPAIKVTIAFLSAPSQLGSGHPFAYHAYKDASGVDQAELVTDICTLVGGVPTNTTPCLTLGTNSIVVWLFHNGNMRM